MTVTKNSPLPVGPVYLHDEVGHIDHPSCAVGPTGDVFYLFMFTPGTWTKDSNGKPVMNLDTDETCIILKRKHKENLLQEIDRFRSAESGAWLLAHGVDKSKSQGKYGPPALCIAGDDIIIVFNIRINGCQTPTEWRIRGAAR